MAYIQTTNQYAQIADLKKYGMTAGALQNPATGAAAQTSALLAASAQIDGALSRQLNLPVVSWGDDVVMYCCWLASWTLINLRGYDPENKGDAVYKQRYDLACEWLEGIKSDRLGSTAVGTTPGDAYSNYAVPSLVSPAPYDCWTGDQTRGTNARH
jgi:phage gp36-like protein